MRVRVTQYGYPNDPDSDSETRAGIGCHNNKLNINSCALTRPVEDGLQISPGTFVQLIFPDGNCIIRSFDDRAPESDPRVDLYMPGGLMIPSRILQMWKSVKASDSVS